MPPIRILTAVPICDGHDSAINTINLELVRLGIEVIYLGYNRSAKDIVRAAIQEDGGIYNTCHIDKPPICLVAQRIRNGQLRRSPVRPLSMHPDAGHGAGGP